MESHHDMKRSPVQGGSAAGRNEVKLIHAIHSIHAVLAVRTTLSSPVRGGERFRHLQKSHALLGAHFRSQCVKPLFVGIVSGLPYGIPGARGSHRFSPGNPLLLRPPEGVEGLRHEADDPTSLADKSRREHPIQHRSQPHAPTLKLLNGHWPRAIDIGLINLWRITPGRMSF